MCVIMIARDARPTNEMIEKAWKKNDDGGGIAWREHVKDEKGKKNLLVRWDKGIEDVEEMKRYCREKPLPYIVHFRIASCGGIKPELTHPFPIDEGAQLMLQGQTGGYVLFHNGHWSKWQDYSMDMVIHLNKKAPKGPWSDTRAMAWAAGEYGNEVLNFTGEKCVIFSPTDLELFRKDWDIVQGVLCSNKYFLDPPTQSYYGANYRQEMCKFGTCTSKNIDKDGFCVVHRKVTVVTLPDDTQTDDDPADMTLPVLAQVGASGTGGSPTADPFAFLDRLLKEGRLSKNRYKKLKRKLEAQQARLETPIVVKNLTVN